MEVINNAAIVMVLSDNTSLSIRIKTIRAVVVNIIKISNINSSKITPDINKVVNRTPNKIWLDMNNKISLFSNSNNHVLCHNQFLNLVTIYHKLNRFLWFLLKILWQMNFTIKLYQSIMQSLRSIRYTNSMLGLVSLSLLLD
jgi:hypothetical protein